MLSKIVSGVIKIKWSEIAKSLFTNSERLYVRTSKQCRERWLNHLDPSKTKLNWSLEECKLLLKSVLENGKKWASLVQILGGRRS
jgi:myb proto-oncogene protein